MTWPKAGLVLDRLFLWVEHFARQGKFMLKCMIKVKGKQLVLKELREKLGERVVSRNG
jgi:hypothetical protein